MSATTATRRPGSPPLLKRIVIDHPVAAFLVMLYTITWIIFLSVVLQ
jgi:hypothetical protein